MRHLCLAGYTIFTGLLRDKFFAPFRTLAAGATVADTRAAFPSGAHNVSPARMEPTAIPGGARSHQHSCSTHYQLHPTDGGARFGSRRQGRSKCLKNQYRDEFAPISFGCRDVSRVDRRLRRPPASVWSGGLAGQLEGSIVPDASGGAVSNSR
jgi:hypothetical protein